MATSWSYTTTNISDSANTDKIWKLMDHQTGGILDTCLCDSVQYKRCDSDIHKCTCGRISRIKDPDSTNNITRIYNHYELCKSKNHECICNYRNVNFVFSNRLCRSKHLKRYKCKCPNANVMCDYNSDEITKKSKLIAGHICICKTQGPETCLANLHSCSCSLLGTNRNECLYSRPSNWHKPLPEAHKRNILNELHLTLGKKLVTEVGILLIIADYAGGSNNNIDADNIWMEKSYFDTEEKIERIIDE